MTRVGGLDISRGNVHTCVLESIPVDLLEFARSYKPRVYKASAEELAEFAELGDIFVMNPTGADHRIFHQYLKGNGKIILGCTETRVRNFARDSGLLNKTHILQY